MILENIYVNNVVRKIPEDKKKPREPGIRRGRRNGSAKQKRVKNKRYYLSRQYRLDERCQRKRK